MKKRVVEKGIVEYIDPKAKKLQEKLKRAEKKFAKKEDKFRELSDFLNEFDRFLFSRLKKKVEKLEKLEEEFSSLQFKSEESPDIDFEEIFRQFGESFKNKESVELSDTEKEERAELKSIFKKTSKLIHPDIVSEEDRDRATEIFQELNNHYKEGNLLKVREIYRRVSENEPLKSVAEQKLDMKLLKKEIDTLEDKINDLEFHITILEHKIDEIPEEEWEDIAINSEKELDSAIEEINFKIRKFKRELSGNFRIPQDRREKFREIVEITDSVAEEFFDEEYKFLFKKLSAQISRKRDKPTLKGTSKSWGVGVVIAVLEINEKRGYLGKISNFLEVSQTTRKTYANRVLELSKKSHYDYMHSSTISNSSGFFFKFGE